MRLISQLILILIICILHSLFYEKIIGVKNYPMGMNSTNILSNGRTIHAEIKLLSKLSDIFTRSISILVIRLSKDGKLKESKPCYHCLQQMKMSGIPIKYVYYSTSNGNIIRETFSKMQSNYITKGSRY